MSDPETVVRAWIDEVWTSGNLERLPEFHPARFTNEGAPSTPTEAAAWHRRNHETFPDVAYAIDELIVCDDRVTVRWTATGTHLGALWGQIPPTGRRISWRGIHLLTVRASRVVEVWGVADLAGMLQALGVGPELPE